MTSTALLADTRSEVQLDQTCFYPRGGGQDWGHGVIKNTDASAILQVQEVRLDSFGFVHHIGTYTTGAFKEGEAVFCHVDEERRTKNSRLHSAGHVIDLAVDRLGLPWIPGRGAHYPDVSFVEYEGSIDPHEGETIRQRIEATANSIITKGGQNEIRFMPVSAMHNVCRHVPNTIPTNKPARVVMYDGMFGVPCGGTHVLEVSDIGQLTITKLKTKKGFTKVSYRVEGVT